MVSSDQSSTAPPSKHKKLSESSTDRISQLPESVLHHIISFLDSKEAARTSVLSKRWQYLWAWVPVIDVYASELRDRDLSFEQIIFKILVSRREWGIKKFGIYCDVHCKYVHLLDSLLRAAVARNVEEFCFVMEKRVIDMPPCLFSCKTLVALTLSGKIAIGVGSPVHLPSLKILRLDDVRYVDDESVRNILSGCPILEQLTVFRYEVDNVVHYEITSPTLRSLIMLAWTGDFCIEPLQSITVNAPALKSLTIDYCPITNLVLKNMDTLVLAEVDLHQIFYREQIRRGCVLDDFQALCNLQSLILHGNLMREIDGHISSLDNFPKFKKLIHLKLIDFCCSWRLLQHLLHNSPCLEHLTLIRILRPAMDHSCVEPQCWTPQPDVPNFLSSHLITFKFLQFKGLEVEIEFTRYILENSKVLRNTTISCCPGSNLLDKFGILQKLSRFERGSTRCQLNFEKTFDPNSMGLYHAYFSSPTFRKMARDIRQSGGTSS